MQQKQLTPKEQMQLSVVVVVVIGAAIGFGMFMANGQEKEIHDTPLSRQRTEHPTSLKHKGPAPQEGVSLRSAPAGAQFIEYNSNAGKMGAWIMRPARGGKHPALLWAHGGFALGEEDLKQVQPFVEAGYVVLVPAWRGENGNPGNFEMCFGEVDDAAAALKYLQACPDVDADNIFAAGHSIGGTIVCLLAETNSGLKKVAACGAYPNMRASGPYDGAPFNGSDIYETECRSPADHVKDLTCPLLLTYGTDDSHFLAQAKEMKKAASAVKKHVEVAEIKGTDHFTSLNPAISMMIDEFRRN